MRDHTQPARRRHRLLLIAAATVAIVVPGLVAGNPAVAATGPTSVTVGGVHAAPAVPDSAGPRCGTGSSSGNVNTCITIQGSGEHVDWILATAQVADSGRSLQICIHGPNGPIKCNPSGSYHFTGPGEEISVTCCQNTQQPEGDYCANTWTLNNDGSNTEIGHECVNVHT